MSGPNLFNPGDKVLISFWVFGQIKPTGIVVNDDGGETVTVKITDDAGIRGDHFVVGKELSLFREGIFRVM